MVQVFMKKIYNIYAKDYPTTNHNTTELFFNSFRLSHIAGIKIEYSNNKQLPI